MPSFEQADFQRALTEMSRELRAATDGFRQLNRETERSAGRDSGGGGGGGPAGVPGGAAGAVLALLGNVATQSATAGIQSFNATASVSGAANSAAMGFAQTMHGLPFGELKAAIAGTGTLHGAVDRTQSRVQDSLEDLARYGIEIDDQVLRQDVEETLKQEQRVGKFRDRVSTVIAESPDESTGGTVGGTLMLGQMFPVAVRLLTEIRDMMASSSGGGGPR